MKENGNQKSKFYILPENDSSKQGNRTTFCTLLVEELRPQAPFYQRKRCGCIGSLRFEQSRFYISDEENPEPEEISRILIPSRPGYVIVQTSFHEREISFQAVRPAPVCCSYTGYASGL